MKVKSFRLLAASCAFSLVPVASNAQVGTPTLQPGQASGQVTQQGAPGGVITQGQTNGVRAQAGGVVQGQPASQGIVHASPGAHQNNTGVQDFLINKLMLSNKSEVELGQIATDKSQNDEVKQFAQMLVQDHQQMNQQLAQLQAGGQGANQSSSQGGSVRNSNASGQNSASAQVQPGTQGESPRGSVAGQSGNVQAGQSQPGNNHSASGHALGQEVPQQLTMITQQTCAKELDMARQMLNEHQGQDFDMGFLGMQIAHHTHAVAELQSIQDVGSPEFQQLIRTAEQKTSQHLAQAKELANKLKDQKTSR